MGEQGIGFDTDFTESDLWACIAKYEQKTGKTQPDKVITRIENKESVNWLADLGIIVKVASVEIGTILLV